MDVSKFHTEEYSYKGEKKILNFDFNILAFQKKKKNGKRFTFHETLLEFLSSNPNQNIYITESVFDNGGFQIKEDNIFLNINEFQRFCHKLKDRLYRADAFFRQDVSIENLTLTGATEAQILGWIKSLSDEERKGFLGKIDGGFSIVNLTDSQLLNEIKNRGNGVDSIGALVDSVYSKREIDELGEKIDLTRINSVLNFWENHKKNKKEIETWQPFFKENFWVISQIFASSISFFDDEFYAGGLSQGNTKGGKWIDFIGKNKFSHNVALIEIKTPVGSLVQKKEYGDRVGIYPMHNDLIGAISQVLDQKHKIITESKFNNKGKSYEVFDPRSILIIGSEQNDHLQGERLACFELFKASQKDIEIITYEELFDKIQTLKDLLTKA